MILGDMELFRHAVDDAGENEGRVFLTTLSLSIKFAASEVTKSGGGVEKLFSGNERLEFGTALSLDAGHSGRVHRGLLSYIFIIFCCGITGTFLPRSAGSGFSGTAGRRSCSSLQ